MRQLAFYLSLAVVFSMPWKDIVRSEFGTIGKMLGMVLAAVWVVSVAARGGVRRFSGFHLFAALFFLWNVVSLLWTVSSEDTLYRISRYVQMFGLTVIVWDLYRTDAHVRAGLQAFVLGTFVPIVSTLLNYASGTQVVYGRYAASGQAANLTAVNVALGIPIVWYLISRADQSRTGMLLRSINFAFIPASMFVISLTATRFAIVMAAPALLYGISTQVVLTRKSWIVTALVLAATAIIFLRLSPESSLERLATIRHEVTSGDLTGRTHIWAGAYDIWLKNPFVGVGGGAFQAKIANHAGRRIAAHNSFVAVATELGLVGLLLFCGTLAASAWYAVRQQAADSRFWLVLGAVWILGNLAASWEDTQQTWWLLTLVVAASCASRQVSSLNDPETSPVTLT